jgi:hypothetical protein
MRDDLMNELELDVEADGGTVKNFQLIAAITRFFSLTKFSLLTCYKAWV